MIPLADPDLKRTVSDPPVGPGTHPADSGDEGCRKRRRGGLSLGRLAQGAYGEQARAFVKSLRARGKTVVGIARAAGIARSTVSNIIHRAPKTGSDSLAAFLIQITPAEREILGFAEQWQEMINSTQARLNEMTGAGPEAVPKD